MWTVAIQRTLLRCKMIIIFCQTVLQKYPIYQSSSWVRLTGVKTYHAQVPLKRQCHEIFCSRFFLWIIFPQAPENSITVISNFFRKYLPVKVHHHQICHRYQGNQWQIMGTISDCLHLKVNLKIKVFIYMLTVPTGVQSKYLKLFWLEIFSICHQCQRHRWYSTPWVANISTNFRKKFETALMGYSGPWGNLVHEKKHEAKNLVALSL